MDSRKREFKENQRERTDTRFKESKKFTFNDPQWYRHYDTLSKDVSTLFMSRPTGIPYPDRKPPTGVTPGSSLRKVASDMGGILTLDVIPSFGGTSKTNYAGSPLNVAAGKLYYYIVHGNSRNISYDKSDLMRCLMGFDSLQCVIADAIRAYKFIKAVDPQNKYYKAILARLGWNADNLREHIVEFRAAINFAIQRFNQISIPDVFDIFKAHKHMYDYVYCDRPGEKAQYIIPRLPGFWFYNDEKATVDWVERIKWNTYDINYYENRSVGDFKLVTEFLLHTLYDSTDMGVMQGDIRKAFPTAQMLTMYMLDEDNDVPLIYDAKEFNLKVHNMEFYPKSVSAGEYSLTTDNLTYYPQITYRDSDLVDGNLFMLINKAADEGYDDSTFYYNEHLMDLPDELSNDVDSVIQMQLFKADVLDQSDFTKFYLSDSGDDKVFLCGETGPYMVTCARWFSQVIDAEKSVTGSAGLEIRRTNVWNTGSSVPFQLLQYMTMSQLAVTFIANIWVKGGAPFVNENTPLPPMWETQNVTSYGITTFRNIIRVCMESLYFAPELYNAQSR